MDRILPFLALTAALPLTAQEATVIGDVLPVRALAERDGRSFQPVQVRLVRTGGAREETFLVDGKPVRTTLLGPGPQEVELLLPAVDRARTVTVSVGASSREALLKPVPKLTIYLVPHSHTDIGYTALQPEIEARQAENLAKGMDLARRTAAYPEGARFVWNVEAAWAVDQFLARKDGPARAEFAQAVREGRVALGGMYLNTLSGLCRPEELIQEFRFGTRLAERYGVVIDTAMTSDVPGHTWGLVPALAQAGIRYFSTCPNFFDRIGTAQAASADQPFWWVGPDGRSRVLTWNTYQGYALSHGWEARITPERVNAYLDHLDAAAYPYDVTYIRWSGLGDNAEPDPGLSDFVRDWQARYRWPRFIISDQRAPFAELERRYPDRIPVRYGDWTPYWEDGAASSARETALNRRTADRMTQAEALWALRDPAHWPADLADRAWKKVLLYSEHTWGAYNSVSEPGLASVADQWAIKKGYAEEADALSRSLLERAAPGPGLPDAVDVANTTSWPRTEVVRLPRERSGAGDRVLGPDGGAVPSQRLATGELAFLVRDLPGFAGRRYRVVPGAAAAPREGRARAKGRVLANGLLEARLDPATGDVSGFAAGGREWVDRGATGLGGYLFFAGSDPGKAQGSGPACFTVVEPGPLVAVIRAESSAPGARSLRRDFVLEAGSDRLGLEAVVDKARAQAGPGGDYFGPQSKESVNLAFPFALPGAELRMDLPLAGVMRPDLEQIPGSCKNWFTVGSWADLSAPGAGLTWATLDAPLLQVGGLTANLLNSQSDPRVWRASTPPSSHLFAWLMNNHWGTNYRAWQEGPVAFRFALRPHGPFDPGAAHRFAAGLGQPLLLLPAQGPAPSGRSRLRVSGGAVVTAFKPSDDGKAWILRLYNPSGRDARVEVAWDDPRPRAVRRSGTSEAPGAPVQGPLDLPAWGILTLRAER